MINQRKLWSASHSAGISEQKTFRCDAL